MDKSKKITYRLGHGLLQDASPCTALKSVYMHYDDEGEPMVKLHSHRFYELAVVQRGNGTHLVEGRSYPMETGSAFLIVPGEKHDYRFEGALTLMNFIFLPRLLRTIRQPLLALPGFADLFRRGAIKPTLRVSPSALAELDLQFNAIVEENRLRQPGFELALRTSLTHAFLLILRNNRCGNGLPRLSGSFAEAVSYVLAHLQTPITIPQLARIAHLAPGTFYQRFVRDFGEAPTQWLLKQRMRKAKEFLMRSDLTIAEVAHAVGFEDPLYFSRKFSRYEGCSPSEYRATDHGNRQVFRREAIDHLA